MPLTEKEYSKKLRTITNLAWDMDKFRLGIQCRTTNPNPYCVKELDEAIVSMKALLIQFKTHNVDSDGRDLNQDDRWWVPDIEKSHTQVMKETIESARGR